MKRARIQIAVFGTLALLGMSGGALGQCLINSSLEEAGATSVVDLQGQGNFSCVDMSPGPDGGAMGDISGDVTFTQDPLDPTRITIDVLAAALPAKEIDAVYIEAKGNGARCLYSFSDYSPSAINLEASGDSFTDADVVVCADGVGEEPPVEPTIVEPVSTVGDGCEGTIFVENTPLTGDQQVAVVSAVSLDGNTLAVCSGDDGDPTTPVTPQFQCVNVCENFTPRAETQACIDASVDLQPGELDLQACAPCDLTVAGSPPAEAEDENGNLFPVFYCWEYTNSVVRDLDAAGFYPDMYPTPIDYDEGVTERSENTMLPHKQAWSASEETEIFNGCYKKTVYLNGRAYTYTTCY